MLRLKDFQDFKVEQFSQIRGGVWTSTAGGTKVVLMQTFTYGGDCTQTTYSSSGSTSNTAYCGVTGSSYPGTGTYAGSANCSNCP